MDVFEKSLQLLDEYFAGTSPSLVEERMHVVDNMHVYGPTVSDYFLGFESEFLYKEWLQFPELPCPMDFNDFRKVTQLDFNVNLDNSQYGKTNFSSTLLDKFIATDSRKQAA